MRVYNVFMKHLYEYDDIDKELFMLSIISRVYKTKISSENINLADVALIKQELLKSVRTFNKANKLFNNSIDSAVKNIYNKAKEIFESRLG